MHEKSFSDEVCKELKWYVYRLIDPRNGETFYVGKGRENRVFNHIKDSKGDKISDKLDRIRAIKNAGLDVLHTIHRHGMDQKTALVVEGALIDDFPGLTNSVNGVGNNYYRVMHADGVIERYCKDVANFGEYKVLILSVQRSSAERDLYTATQLAWKLNPIKARKADFVLGVVCGVIEGDYVAEQWLPAISRHFEGFPDQSKRHGFKGCEASGERKEQYLGKRIPEEFRKPGAPNPVRYSWTNSNQDLI